MDWVELDNGRQQLPQLSATHCCTCRALGSPPSADGNGTVTKRKKRQSTECKLETFSDSDPGVPELLGDHPLKLILIGSNPSGHAW